MAVLKHTSPTAELVAPSPWPSIAVPFASTRSAVTGTGAQPSPAPGSSFDMAMKTGLVGEAGGIVKQAGGIAVGDPEDYLWAGQWRWEAHGQQSARQGQCRTEGGDEVAGQAPRLDASVDRSRHQGPRHPEPG